MLVLASQSPRRAELLRAAGIEFKVVAPAEEGPNHLSDRGGYAALVKAKALHKARSVAAGTRALVLGADTIVVCEKKILGKPTTKADARRMLELLSGRRHVVYTGVALVCGKLDKVAYERTEVAFRPLSKTEISRYLMSGEPMDKAGAYAIQGAGAAFVRAIRGCYTNVVGLPIPLVLRMLREFAAAGAADHGSEGRKIRPSTKRGRG